MDWAGAVLTVEAAPASAARAAAPRERPTREHHEECDKVCYEGGTCTCALIERYGPNSERDDYRPPRL
ncbi:hypothetical protein [Streptomyces doudnae]|uniref:Uncharacterized protein n=1 Tax=Streptomyces doudnae TaxID=3075536 RepID=A0ABD5F0P4_9ACTN|nr:hypothetical protein [Streptomyces sp. DSM 41981]MDT0440376.1 hypothetical protein [Streptomyces sp. DSM 41981]